MQTIGTVDVDLTSPAFWTTNPLPAFAELRRSNPVFLHAGTAVTGGKPFWVALKHADVVRISRDPKTFRSGDGVNVVASDEAADLESLHNLTTMDDPEHKWMRALVSRGFTPPRIRELEPRIREHATRILDRAAQLDVVDFVSDIAAELPLVVIGELIGVPAEDQHLLNQWGHALAAGFNSADDAAGTFTSDAMVALQELFAYLRAMEEERAVRPTGDLTSLLLTAEVDGRGLTAAERQAFFLLLWFAGNETTRFSTAGGMEALSAFPDEKAKLVADPALIAGAAEEFIRWTTPISHFRRTVSDDTELGGHQLRAGDWVVMAYTSANRDEDVFDQPDRLDVQRSPNPHVAFGGGGPHFCLGGPLARLEVRVMFEELLRRFPDIEVTGPATRSASAMLPGIASLPVDLGDERR